MDEVKSAESAAGGAAGDRIPNDSAPPSSMNDLEALDIVKVCPLLALSAVYVDVCLIVTFRF